MMSLESLYIDNFVIIKHIDDYIQCEWIAKSEINHSYMTAKLSELIGNKFPGSWPVKDIGEAKSSRRMKCFIMEWFGDTLRARWI